jgi:hypothetical protein
VHYLAHFNAPLHCFEFNFDFSSICSPFGEGKNERYQQIQEIIRPIERDTLLIIGGDYNMRQNEDLSVEKMGLRDAWKESGCDKSQKNTWDSVDRSPRDRPETGPWNRYHANGYPFACRFDRMYFRGEKNFISPTHFQLFANTPLTSPSHFLSDHFGIKTTFSLNPHQEQSTAYFLD